MEHDHQLDSPTPAPSALQELIAKWRARAEEHEADAEFDRRFEVQCCADELEILLAGVVPHRRQQEETKDELSRGGTPGAQDDSRTASQDAGDQND